MTPPVDRSNAPGPAHADDADGVAIGRCAYCSTYAPPWHRCVVREPAAAESPRLDPLVARDPPRRFDAERHAWDAARDLELLAHPRWVRHFYGRALDPGATGGGGGNGDVDRADGAAVIERERVTAVHARLEALRAGAGRRHYAVLWWAYVQHGPAFRTSEAFLERLGVAFATRGQRAVWRGLRRSAQHGAARTYGERLLAAAAAAYEATPGR